MLGILQNLITGYYAFFIAGATLLADRFLKTVIAEKILIGEKIIILKDILSITNISNTGAAFGIFQDKVAFLALFSIIITVCITVYLWKSYKTLDLITNISWGLILGGTIGNFIDRLCFGYVVDFISIDFVSFPVFNVADMCINIGAVLLIYKLIVNNKTNDASKVKAYEHVNYGKR